MLMQRLKELEAYPALEDAFAGPGHLRPLDGSGRYGLALTDVTVLVLQAMDTSEPVDPKAVTHVRLVNVEKIGG